jgi:hypothetical protein
MSAHNDDIPTTKRERDLMEHALGWPKCYRNHFAASPESEDARVLDGMIERGLVDRRPRPALTDLISYHVTDLGKAQLPIHECRQPESPWESDREEDEA